jgi:hypothetical protein
MRVESMKPSPLRARRGERKMEPQRKTKLMDMGSIYLKNESIDTDRDRTNKYFFQRLVMILCFCRTHVNKLPFQIWCIGNVDGRESRCCEMITC